MGMAKIERRFEWNAVQEELAKLSQSYSLLRINDPHAIPEHFGMVREQDTKSQ